MMKSGLSLFESVYHRYENRNVSVVYDYELNSLGRKEHAKCGVRQKAVCADLIEHIA